MVILLELFSGTGSVGNAFRDRGWDVVPLDLLMPADIKTDILKWNYQEAYPTGHFTMIWASPPCAEWNKKDRRGT